MSFDTSGPDGNRLSAHWNLDAVFASVHGILSVHQTDQRSNENRTPDMLALRCFVSFAITAYESEVPRAPGVCGLAARAAGSADERLATYGHQTLLARPRDGARQDQVLQMGFFTFRPFADFDGIFFLAHSPSMLPLRYPGCR